jgi:hypothetical protein
MMYSSRILVKDEWITAKLTRPIKITRHICGAESFQISFISLFIPVPLFLPAMIPVMVQFLSQHPEFCFIGPPEYYGNTLC